MKISRIKKYFSLKNLGNYLFIAILMINFPIFADKRNNSLRKFGDMAQIVNPLVVAAISTQDKGLGHFAFIYSQQFVLMHGIKIASKSAKADFSKRPYVPGKRDRFEGMPSGHTVSAWSAASYLRVFGENKLYSVPFYITAAITGYSRVRAKDHTYAQVIVGAALSEYLTYLNSTLDWSKNYVSSSVNLGKNSGSLSFEIKF
jgi:membrane-associated phospholipid phosphatase